MNYPANLIREQITNILPLLKEKIYTKVAVLHTEGYLTKEPVKFADRMTGDYRELKAGDQWGSLFDCAWFHITGAIPPSAKGMHVVLLIDLSGEGCVFDSAGCPVRGITNVTSEFESSLGLPGKRVLQLAQLSTGEELVDVWIDAGCNDLFGNFQGDGKIVQSDIALCNDNARGLYYDIKILDDLLDCIDHDGARYYSVLYAMQEAVSMLSDFNDEEYLRARAALQGELDKTGGTPSLSFHAIGHAHIDLAWLWPIRESKRKGARTFSTALDLLERYPDYIFGASQPQLFEWIQQEYPLLFSKIKQKVKEGRFELQGGMWVESDTNIPCGESLVRQFLYGKKYFREQFNIDVKFSWLPDVFGYTASLPQIMKKSGCDYFTTTKMSWNKLNKFPYHTFRWAGIDGSEVLVHMPPEGTYNSASLPHSYINAQKSYQEKGLCNQALCLFGIGDGGGGPGPEHLERLKRLKNLDGVPPVKQTTAQQFYDEIEVHKKLYSKYKGELYFEMHQGTLTSQTYNKKMNRNLENKLHTAELLLTQSYLKNGLQYPHEKLDKIWKEVLLYQFHDILTGSSIKRVYDESHERYDALASETDKLIQIAIDNLCNSPRKSVYNQLPWRRTEIIRTDSGFSELKVPAFSFASIDTAVKTEYHMAATKDSLENDLISIHFNESGYITSIYDKQCRQECIADGQTGNELVIFTDIGDAWDFPVNYRDLKKSVFELKEVSFRTDNCYAVRSSIYQFHNSMVYQDVVLQGGGKLLDFKTRVQWNEKNKMLRSEFPLNIQSDTVSCDIQFGHIKRSTMSNNSIEAAQYEIAAHKWIDLSQADYGVSLLNDCKYGHYAKENILSINLLRSQNYPAVHADMGEHCFNYAIYPHNGNVYDCDVEKMAYEYNNHVLQIDGFGDMPFIAMPDQENIIIETIKMSENDSGIIVRLYENKGRGVDCNLRFNNRFHQCVLTNLIEDDIVQLNIMDSCVKLRFNPFEVHTLRLLLR